MEDLARSSPFPGTPLGRRRGRTPTRTRSRDPTPEPTPVAAVNAAWSSSLRDGDLMGGIMRGSGGGGGGGDRRTPRGERARDDATAVDLAARLEAADLGKSRDGAVGGRMFSRAFRKLYLEQPEETVSGSNRRTPGIKTKGEDLVGVVGFVAGKHKEDLRHRAASQPVSHHRSVVGRHAGYTGMPKDSPSRYPRAKESPKVWVPSAYA